MIFLRNQTDFSDILLVKWCEFYESGGTGKPVERVGVMSQRLGDPRIEHSRLRRIPLRDVLNHVEHRMRELVEHLRTDVSPAVHELHQLTRPKRKKSPYPSIRSICNVQERLRRSHERSLEISQEIEECVAAIEDRIGEVHG